MGYCYVIDPYTAFSMGYILYDLVLILSYKDLFFLSTLFHHFLTFALEVVAMRWRFGVLYELAFFLTEITTPILNIRWCFQKAKMDSSLIATLNSIGLWLGFLIFRVIAFWLLFYYSWMFWDAVWLLPYPQGYCLIAAQIALAVLNLYWFALLTKRALAMVKKEDKQK